MSQITESLLKTLRMPSEAVEDPPLEAHEVLTPEAYLIDITTAMQHLL